MNHQVQQDCTSPQILFCPPYQSQWLSSLTRHNIFSVHLLCGIHQCIYLDKSYPIACNSRFHLPIHKMVYTFFLPPLTLSSLLHLVSQEGQPCFINGRTPESAKAEVAGRLKAAAWSQHSSAPACNDARRSALLVTAQPVFSRRGLYEDLSATRHT